MIFIESKENTLFKETKKLKERKNRNKYNKYIIEGFRLVEEAFKAGLKIEYIILTNEEDERIDKYITKYLSSDIKPYCMNTSLFKELISTERPQGILAVAEMNMNNEKLDGNFYVLCDKLQDPGNLGTIIRTAHAAGADGIILTKGTVDIYNDKTIRSTMGSIFHIPIMYDDENFTILKKLKEKEFKVITTSLDTDKNFYDENLKCKVVLTVGNEGNGVSDEIYSLSDNKVKIPMPGGAESLNAAVAASIIMFEKVRQDTI